MLSNPIIEQLKSMKLNGMAEALSEQWQENSTSSLSFEDRLGLLVDREHGLRINRLLQSRLRQAKLHITQASLADIDYQKERALNKQHIAELATGQWLEAHQNVVLTGATGTGKSYLACALGHKACMLGCSVRYWRLSRLLEELDLAKGDGRYLTMMKALARVKLLIIDDWGMLKIQGQHQQMILDILDDRYQKQSTLTTSQLPIAGWYEQIKDATFADSILDRLLGQSQLLQLSGPSMRTRKTQREKN